MRRKNTKFIAIICVLSSSRCTKTRFRLGLRPGHRWGSLQRSPRFHTVREEGDILAGSPEYEITPLVCLSVCPSVC